MKTRILIIEDNSERIARIRDWLPREIVAVHARSAGMALGILQRDAKCIAGIMLDHDLQENPYTLADRSLSGSSLVHTIVRLVPRQIPILIHSMNAGGAQAMARRLGDGGFSVTRIPMAELTRENLSAWIADEVMVDLPDSDQS